MLRLMKLNDSYCYRNWNVFVCDVVLRLTMSKTLDLENFKNKKKYKQIVSDINAITHVLDLTIRSLIHFKKYRTVQELISVLQTDITLLGMHKSKYENQLAKTEE